MDFKWFTILFFADLRLAQLFAYDDGPMWVFARLRQNIDARAKAEQDAEHGKLWQSVSDGVHCPYCVGLWLAFILLLIPKRYSVLLYPLAIAGAQSWLEGMKK